MIDYRALNRAVWDERAGAHAASRDYDVERLVRDPAHLSDVVRFDLPRLGDLRGLEAVHLQCHIGTDTVSLARLGAQVAGVDFSAVSLAHARSIAARCEADVTFVEADVYDAPGLLREEHFDLVYTGIGALCWLPDIRRWAGVVARLLRPGGRLFMREGHPMLWSLAPARADRLLLVDAPYFERPEPVALRDYGTYVPTQTTFVHTETHTWNHGLGEIMTSLLDVGMRITQFIEHDSIPWDDKPGQMERIGDGEWRLVDRPWRLPHSYTLQAVKHDG